MYKVFCQSKVSGEQASENALSRLWLRAVIFGCATAEINVLLNCIFVVLSLEYIFPIILFD